jgi:hypothetical protein
VISARSVITRLVSCRHQHAGNQPRQDLERGAARGLVELFPKARCEGKQAAQWIGRIEKKAKFSCKMAALLWRCRPDRSATESIDEMAQLKQIAKAAKSTRAGIGFPARAHTVTMTFVPVSPLGRDQRATAVREAGQREQNAAAADTADDGERTTLKRMALASDNYRIGKIPAMGSLSPLLSTRSTIPG